jgi:hypothetical protein
MFTTPILPRARYLSGVRHRRLWPQHSEQRVTVTTVVGRPRGSPHVDFRASRVMDGRRPAPLTGCLGAVKPGALARDPAPRWEHRTRIVVIATPAWRPI